MAKVIWKLTLELSEGYSYTLPEGAKILCVHEQFNDPQIWFLCETTNKVEIRKFATFGTGHEIHENVFNNLKEYIGTFQTDGGNYVFHVWELLK